MTDAPSLQDRFRDLIGHVVDFHRRKARATAAIAALISALSVAFAAATIEIDTDTDALINPDLPFLQAERAVEALFPAAVENLVVVVSAPDPIAAEQGAERLRERMETRPDLFIEVSRPTGGAFFRRHAMLYLSPEALADIVAELTGAQGFIAALNRDPSLRGLLDGLTPALMHRDRLGEDAGNRLDAALDETAAAVAAANADAPLAPTWRTLFVPGATDDRNRRFIVAKPRLDVTRLAQAAEAVAFVRLESRNLRLDRDGRSVALTGETMLADEELAVVSQGALLATLISITAVIGLLYRAFRSMRYVAAIALTLIAALATAFGFAAISVGGFNPISMAFSAMFIGLAVDFGIQFSMRHGFETQGVGDRAAAMRRTARRCAPSLTLAAATVSCGFLSFLPTDYLAVRELGIISAGGIVIALIYNLTLLPALLTLFQARPGRPMERPRWIAALEGVVRRRRKIILTVAFLGGAAAAMQATALTFDFDPIKLKDPDSESVRTLNMLRDDVWATPDVISTIAADLDRAVLRAAQLQEEPTVRRALTLEAFIPADQQEKLALIEDLRFVMEPALHPFGGRLAPPDVIATREAVARFLAATADLQADPPMQGLRAALIAFDARLAGDDEAQGLVDRFNAAMFAGFEDWIAFIAESLEAQPIARDDLPEELRRHWIAEDGSARIQLFPQGDPRKLEDLKAFVTEIRAVAPEAVGVPVTLYETGKSVVKAFIQAGALAFAAAALWPALWLRRIDGVFHVICPLALSASYVLGLCAAFGIEMNFANIIALPLMMGIGVSYPIYFVVAARLRETDADGDGDVMPSVLARAVFYSALTTMAAFASLTVSSHRGAADIGFLLCLSLATIMLTAFTVTPALMSRTPNAEPRRKEPDGADGDSRP